MKPRWRAIALLVIAPSGCASSADVLTGADGGRLPTGFCSALSIGVQGVLIGNCARPAVSLRDVHYTQTATRQSYGFVATCGTLSAHGTWDSSTGALCLDGMPCDGDTCVPTSETDCRLQPNCEQQGACGYSNGQCVITDEGCAFSQLSCGVNGQCHLGPDGTCIVTSDADCQMPFGVCPACTFQGACASAGNCHFDNGQCVAATDTDCHMSDQCAFAGKCSFQGNSCIAATDADCANSEVCRSSAQCKASGGICSAF
jgi:hypothetical protein